MFLVAHIQLQWEQADQQPVAEALDQILCLQLLPLLEADRKALVVLVVVVHGLNLDMLEHPTKVMLVALVAD